MVLIPKRRLARPPGWPRRGSLGHMDLYAAAADQIDLTVQRSSHDPGGIVRQRSDLARHRIDVGVPDSISTVAGNASGTRFLRLARTTIVADDHPATVPAASGRPSR